MRYQLTDEAQAKVLMTGLWPKVIKALQSGKQLSMEIKDATRTNPQNKILHAIFTDIAEQVEWCGKKLTPDIWKRLCVASWLREKNENPQLIPALDGKGFDVIYQQTSKLTTTQCAELIEWCFAYGVEHGVIFTERSMETSE